MMKDNAAPQAPVAPGNPVKPADMTYIHFRMSALGQVVDGRVLIEEWLLDRKTSVPGPSDSVSSIV